MPMLAQQILLHKDPKLLPQFKGFAVGNVTFGTCICTRTRAPTTHTLSLSLSLSLSHTHMHMHMARWATAAWARRAECAAAIRSGGTSSSSTGTGRSQASSTTRLWPNAATTTLSMAAPHPPAAMSSSPRSPCHHTTFPTSDFLPITICRPQPPARVLGDLPSACLVCASPSFSELLRAPLSF